MASNVRTEALGIRFVPGSGRRLTVRRAAPRAAKLHTEIVKSCLGSGRRLCSGWERPSRRRFCILRILCTKNQVCCYRRTHHLLSQSFSIPASIFSPQYRQYTSSQDILICYSVLVFTLQIRSSRVLNLVWTISPLTSILSYRGTMYYLLDLLLLYSLIGNICDATVHFSQPHQTPYRIFNSSTFVSNNSATSTSMQAYSSGITSSAKTSYPDFISQWSSISGLLAPFSSLDGLETYMFN